MPKVSNLGFPFKRIEAPSKTQMSDLFIGPKGPKWTINPQRLPMKSLVNSRYTKSIVEKAQFMYIIMIDVPVALATHFINMIQKEIKFAFWGFDH